MIGADKILQKSTRQFIEFFFEILWAAKQTLKTPRFIDSHKNLFYASRYQFESHKSPFTSNHPMEYSNSNVNDKQTTYKPSSTRKKSNLKIEFKEKMITEKDLALILSTTANSFKNIQLPISFFEALVKKDLESFKLQLKLVIENHEEGSSHKNEISMIYYKLAHMEEGIELDFKAFYYYFKMNSRFAEWGVFDYAIYQTKSKSLMK